MKPFAIILATGALLAGSASGNDASQYYTNFIRQVQFPSGFERDVSVDSSGQQFSELPIDPGGARFELWTVKSDASQSWLLDSKYVGAFVPVATVAFTTADPYSVVPRTRADQPIQVTVTVDGLYADPSAPEAARKARFLRHVQSYGAGDGANIDRTQATLHTQSIFDSNGTYNLTYTLTDIPGGNRAKVRGEERFSIFTLDDYQAPSSQVASKHIQVWPVADGSLSGIDDGADLRFSTPSLTLTLHDLYPDSRTYAQIYPGQPALGTDGTVIPGTGYIVYDVKPHDKTMVIDDWDNVIEESGEYTIELLTATPFGIDRLDYVTFHINRDIQVNGSVTTVE